LITRIKYYEYITIHLTICITRCTCVQKLWLLEDGCCFQSKHVGALNPFCISLE
jgi:hypothetical protein